MANQWTSTKAFDRAAAEGREMARDDFARVSFPDERNLGRMADGHCYRHGLRNASVIAGAWLDAYHKTMAALFEALAEELSGLSLEALFEPRPGDLELLRGEV